VKKVGSDLAETEKPELAEREESAKRRQIMEGAREVFLAQGFDAASMGEIARKAGVSKGTLYVYFDSKERLFEAIAHEECGAQAETVFSLDPADHDVEAVLTRLGRSFVKFLCRPGAMSPLRTVIAISDRMPEIGREFYETGPAEGVTKLCHYLESQVAAGILTIEDCEVAAAQFLDSCVATILKPLLFNASEAPSDERIDHVVGIAVRTFLAAYRPVPDPAPSGGVNPIEHRLVFQTRNPAMVRCPRRPKRTGRPCRRIAVIDLLQIPRLAFMVRRSYCGGA
jgi:AcrR family transcriptional regulator